MICNVTAFLWHMYIFFIFQLFTICSAVFCIYALFYTKQLFQLHGHEDGSGIRDEVLVGVVAMTVWFIGWNYLAYYFWDIVRSAYWQLKNENEAVLAPGPYDQVRYLISEATLIPPKPTTTYQVMV